MVQDISRKERIYNFIAGNGIKVVQAIFPEYFAKEPVRPTDRYIEYPFVLKNIKRPPRRILDVGCSGSMFPLLLKALGYDVIGVDIRQHPMADRFRFIKKSICDMTGPSGFFDVITAISTIEHIGLKGRYGENVENIFEDRKAIARIHNLLKPKGIFLMTVPFCKHWHVDKNHRIYNHFSLLCMLKNFKFKYTTLPSPEANYDIALIRATK